MIEPFNFANHAHRRQNPLSGEWVLVSPHRNRRPWQGQSETTSASPQQTYEPSCYLCPNNQRMGGAKNPNYQTTYVFNNDFPALQPDTASHNHEHALLRSRAESGECRVVAYSPNHSQTLAELGQPAIKSVIDCWADQYQDLGQHFDWIQVFENKGEIMGCSMPHPHGQIWAQHHAPTLVSKEHELQAGYRSQQGNRLLLDYAYLERSEGTRVVVENADWLAVVPFWAAWPFEILLLPLFEVQRLPELTVSQRTMLAAALNELLTRYDNLFECAFPYSMGWHSAPFDSQDTDHWQLHAHFYPPLLRSASVRKFMVGYEMLAEPQRDITPEQAAAILRDLPVNHYKQAVGG